jgi:hypothetical protein
MGSGQRLANALGAADLGRAGQKDKGVSCLLFIAQQRRKGVGCWCSGSGE